MSPDCTSEGVPLLRAIWKPHVSVRCCSGRRAIVMTRRGSRRAMILVLALVWVFAFTVSGSAQTEQTFQIVGGTWVSGPNGVLTDPAWWLDAPTASFGATLTGPGDFSHRVGGRTNASPECRRHGRSTW